MMSRIAKWLKELKGFKRNEISKVFGPSGKPTFYSSFPGRSIMAQVLEKRKAHEDRVRDRAYFLWVEAGRPMTDGTEFWSKAEHEELISVS